MLAQNDCSGSRLKVSKDKADKSEATFPMICRMRTFRFEIDIVCRINDDRIRIPCVYMQLSPSEADICLEAIYIVAPNFRVNVDAGNHHNCWNALMCTVFQMQIVYASL